MIRYSYIQNQILRLYSMLPHISFPLNISEVVKLLPNCRFMSYQKLSQLTHCSIAEVIQLCESSSGCTHYDIQKDRYLVLYNSSTENNNNIGRQRWTCSHELGHIICKHFLISATKKLAENNLTRNANFEFEEEADYFAATLLCPFPLFKNLNISSSEDVQSTFRLSREASIYRYSQYLKWCRTHLKSSWENDMIKLYKQKS